MPPPTQFAGTFYGDYAAVAVTDHTAYPVWSDTRPVDLFLCPGIGPPADRCGRAEPDNLALRGAASRPQRSSVVSG